MKEVKENIQSALKQFSSGVMADSAKNLLNVLSYESERTLQLSPNNYKGFSELFQTGLSNLDVKKAKVEEWQSIDIIFQLTEDDIRKSQSLFEAKKVDNAIIESYLFFAVALTGEKYTRGDLVKITREINKLTPMPAMILFKYNNYLTVAVIDRRLHKRESSKDVLEKVTLIKDINIAKPHRAHIEILFDLSFQNLADKYDVSNFVALHNAWRKTLDTSELNKKFFRELANWYFWALQNVEFPEDAEKNKDVRNAISVIRMITRLIFIWFVKEKGLIPEDLFNQAKLKSLLNFSDKNQSTYYKAILQNLFFATLNTEMNKDKPGSRKFRGKNKGEGRDQHYMIHNVFRYEDYFASPQDTLKKYFENIPFLNGGLFECLDKEIVGAGLKPAQINGHPQTGRVTNPPLQKKTIRIDGFSDRKDNPLKVPDYLFFSTEQPVNLNEIYGTKNKTYKVRGLIDILDSYKFTVDENTPIEEEIALDPELLGKVFENLLASYNPETQTTARKQTGSFYTPREIVNYMVDESIIAYLSTKLLAKFPAYGKDEKQLDERLRHLVAYNDEPHKFTPTEVDVLIAAINTLKALDPACGSGAFPMGMLHKLVYILGKLDPDNSKWRELQKQKAIKETEEAYKNEDKEEREKRLLDISEVFENNASDYGRKLYLIENCIFGVDIQPIAVQIAKLRFFVSLIVDQRIDSKKENLGVRPLPNLETKFVAANTLIGIEKPAQLSFRNPEIDRKEASLKRVREQHFIARTLKRKRECREKDERLRAEISELLKKDGFPRETTEKLANWNPYDQNASADFFDSEWMFGVTEGFDVVIGNPPYGVELPKNLKNLYETFTWRGESYVVFVEKGIELLRIKGEFTYIVPDTYLNLSFTDALRRYLLSNSSIREIVVLPAKVFDFTTVDTTLLFTKRLHKVKGFHEADIKVNLCDKKANLIDLYNPVRHSLCSARRWNEIGIFSVHASQKDLVILHKVEVRHKPFSNYAEMFYGIKAYQVGKGNPPQTEHIRNTKPYTATKRKDEDFLPFFDGKHIGRYSLLWQNNNWLKYGPWLAEPRNPVKFEGEKLLIRKIIGKTLIATYVPEASYCNTLLYVLKLKPQVDLGYKYLLGILNSHFVGWYFRKRFQISADDTFPQIMIGDILQIPLPVTDSNTQKTLIPLVGKILTAKKKDSKADTSALEKQIDEIVYALYGLTPEEIAIVEGRR